MVEMTETANILQQRHRRAASSSSTRSAAAPAPSTASASPGPWPSTCTTRTARGKTLFATHYHELTDLARRASRGCRTSTSPCKEWNDEIIFLRKIVPGGTNRSYGIQVARLAGLPPAVIERAKEILYSIENGEHAFAGGGRQPVARATPVQLDLFRGAEHQALERLRALDISAMTPLDALNCLSRLQALAGETGEGDALD